MTIRQTVYFHADIVRPLQFRKKFELQVPSSGLIGASPWSEGTFKLYVPGLLRKRLTIVLVNLYRLLLGFGCMVMLCSFGYGDESTNEDKETTSPARVYPEFLRKGVNEWGVWGAVSIKSRTPIGHTIYRSTWLAGIRYGRVVGTKLHTAFEYTLDFVPLEFVRNDPSGPPVDGVEPTHNVYGFGIWPLGIKFILGEGCKIKPFVGINSGLVLFTTAVPWEGRRANVAGNLDAGIHYMLREDRALTFAYKYHHVSNAYTADRNVGTNVNMFMIGYSWFSD